MASVHERGLLWLLSSLGMLLPPLLILLLQRSLELDIGQTSFFRWGFQKQGAFDVWDALTALALTMPFAFRPRRLVIVVSACLGVTITVLPVYVTLGAPDIPEVRFLILYAITFSLAELLAAEMAVYGTRKWLAQDTLLAALLLGFALSLILDRTWLDLAPGIAPNAKTINTSINNGARLLLLPLLLWSLLPRRQPDKSRARNPATWEHSSRRLPR